MTDDELRDTIRRGKPISAKRAATLLERAARAEAELDAAQALVAAVRRWTQHPTSALPIDKADVLVERAIHDALAAYDERER